MTREELKEHCKRLTENCEMWATLKGEKPHGKIYEEHKLILELLDQETVSKEVYDHEYFLRKDFEIKIAQLEQQIARLEQQEPILDKIRAEIEQEIIPRNSDQYDHEAMWQNCGLRIALKVIDKYKADSEG